MNDLKNEIDLVMEILRGCHVDEPDNWARLLTAYNKLDEIKKKYAEVKTDG